MDAGIYRAEVERLRQSLRSLGLVIAETDCELRYVWIDNPHPDFEPANVIGRRDDELIPREEAEPLVALKRLVLAEERTASRVFTVRRSDGDRSYSIVAYPIIEGTNEVKAVLTVGFSSPAG